MAKQKSKSIAKPLALPKQKINLFLLALIAIATVVVYFPSLKNELTNWDDQEYVTENPHILKLDAATIKYQFANETMGNYHPLAMLSLAADHSISGLDPKTYHLTNLILHLLASLMAFVFVFSLTGNNITAFIASSLFALHPMHVESVAWVSERKDVLYGFFLITALWTYIKYIAVSAGKLKWYLFFTALFLCSLLSKAQAVVFPLLCLLIDYLKDRGINKKTILEKIPLFLISLGFGFKAIHAQQTFEAIQDTGLYSYFDRILFSGYGLFTYLWKLFLPVELSTFYPYPIKEGGLYPSIFYLAPMLSAVIIFFIWKFFKKEKMIVFGSLFFLFSVALVLQILPVGGAVIADRYTYIPYLGLFIIAGHYLSKYFSSANGIMALNGKITIAAVLMIFAGLTYQRIGIWKDSVTLWVDAESKSQISPKIYNNLGNAYCNAKQYAQALENLNTALKLKPDYDQAHYDRGLVYFYLKKYSEAVDDYTEAIKCNPQLSRAYFNRSGTYYITGKYKEALDDALKAKELGYDVDPGFIEAIKKDGGLK